MNKSNLILIGMPGSGKTTLGRMLSVRLGMDFIDTDVVLAEALKMPLQSWIETKGVASFRQLEETLVSNLHVENAVVATGGSVVYGPCAMANLKRKGNVVYLQAPLAVVETRIAAQPPRGLVIQPGQTLADVFAERVPLYEAYADVTVEAEGPPEKACDALVKVLPKV